MKSNVRFRVLAFCLLHILLLTRCSQKSEPMSEETAREYFYIISKEAIEKQLLSPTSADFPPSRDAVFQTPNDSIINMAGYVDARNAYGVPIIHFFISTGIYIRNKENNRKIDDVILTSAGIL